MPSHAFVAGETVFGVKNAGKGNEFNEFNRILMMTANIERGMPTDWNMACTREEIALIIEGSLEVKLPTIWTDEKQSREEAERRERLEERRVEEKE